jgi:hypothetical protein
MTRIGNLMEQEPHVQQGVPHGSPRDHHLLIAQYNVNVKYTALQ